MHLHSRCPLPPALPLRCACTFFSCLLFLLANTCLLPLPCHGCNTPCTLYKPICACCTLLLPCLLRWAGCCVHCTGGLSVFLVLLLHLPAYSLHTCPAFLPGLVYFHLPAGMGGRRADSWPSGRANSAGRRPPRLRGGQNTGAPPSAARAFAAAAPAPCLAGAHLPLPHGGRYLCWRFTRAKRMLHCCLLYLRCTPFCMFLPAARRACTYWRGIFLLLRASLLLPLYACLFAAHPASMTAWHGMRHGMALLATSVRRWRRAAWTRAGTDSGSADAAAGGRHAMYLTPLAPYAVSTAGLANTCACLSSFPLQAFCVLLAFVPFAMVTWMTAGPACVRQAGFTSAARTCLHYRLPYR